jgi:isocitrate/isopropylmalate dehydrogenase
MPQLKTEQVLIDALAAMVVLKPGRFDVIVASNLFGDILSISRPRWRARSASRLPRT